MKDDTVREHVSSVIADFPKERASLLPALWAVVDHLGWIDEERLKVVAEVLNLPVADVYGVASFYALLPTTPKQTVRVCDDVLCHLKGSADLLAGLRQHQIEAEPWPCLGRCDQAPAAFVKTRPVVDATVAKVREALQERGRS